MISKTMGIYFSKKFIVNTLAIFVLIFALIFIVDLIENIRRGAGNPFQTLSVSMLLSLYNTPLYAEKAMPFAVLFSGIATLILLNKKMELVVARAAGVSAWQFLLPICLCAALLGVFSSTIYNPLSVLLAQKNKDLNAELLVANGENQIQDKKNFWISNNGGAKGGSVVSAAIAQNEGKDLTNVVMVFFNPDGTVRNRIDSKTAHFLSKESEVDGVVTSDNAWVLKDAKLIEVGKPVTEEETISIPTQLSEQSLKENASAPSELHFWQLPRYIEANKLTNFKIHTFSVHYQTLLLRPLLFVAMILIAATVSLKFVRFGQIGRMILIGITCGFVLFILSELILAFGNNGIISPFASAWTPTIIAILCGTTFLLYQEDG